MKLSDYVIDFVAKQGVKHVFMLAGGGAMHLNNSLGERSDLGYVCCLHEQACAMAAEAYSRVSNNLGVALVTTGPGGTNTVTGVAGAWLDSIPCLFLSGQVQTSQLSDGAVRQIGSQEINIVSVVKSITKYAATIYEAKTIRYHLEKAIHLAKTGRPGPVWIDIPLDIQMADIIPEELVGYAHNGFMKIDYENNLKQVIQKLERSKKPILLIGNGVRLANAQDKILKLIQKLNIPVQTTCPALDLVDNDDRLFVGRPGWIAPRYANFAIQNCDFLLVLGSRLDLATVGFKYDEFAKDAFKVIVDIDKNELDKYPFDGIQINANVSDFIDNLLIEDIETNCPTWIEQCNKWKNKYPLLLDEHKQPGLISTYNFTHCLSQQLTSDDIIVSSGAGISGEIFFLTFKIKQGQRIFHNRGFGAMGYGLPASIGACLASGFKRTILVDGDGSILLNIHELEVIRRLNLPVKIFIINNQGYNSIQTSQTKFFGKLTGADEKTGLTLPNISKIALAFDIPAITIKDNCNFSADMEAILKTQGPILCEVMAIPNEIRQPCLRAYEENGKIISKPLEDLWPWLERDEFHQNME